MHGHGETDLEVAGGALRGRAADGSWFAAHLPFDEAYDGPADVARFAAAVTVPRRWGIVLVRKGGFAVARLEGERVVASKVGRRHVQGKTKAGGQSQQRFARRRANQSRAAMSAAADHAVRILEEATVVVTGGDRSAIEEVLADGRLRTVRPVSRWLAVPDPRRDVLERAVIDAQAVAVVVENAP